MTEPPPVPLKGTEEEWRHRAKMSQQKSIDRRRGRPVGPLSHGSRTRLPYTGVLLGFILAAIALTAILAILAFVHMTGKAA